MNTGGPATIMLRTVLARGFSHRRGAVPRVVVQHLTTGSSLPWNARESTGRQSIVCAVYDFREIRAHHSYMSPIVCERLTGFAGVAPQHFQQETFTVLFNTFAIAIAQGGIGMNKSAFPAGQQADHAGMKHPPCPSTCGLQNSIAKAASEDSL
jgi:hypothetical protein